MSKFDLERAKAGDPVRTTCGKEARIICFDRLAPEDAHIIALVKLELGGGEMYEEPYKMTCAGGGHPYSLEMKPKTVTKWVRYNTAKRGKLCHVYESEVRARASAVDGDIVTSFTYEV
jgi:hypothetical protein